MPLHTVQPAPESGQIDAFRGKAYIIINEISVRDIARLFQDYSGIIGITSTMNGDGRTVHETDITDELKRMRLATNLRPRQHRAEAHA